MTSPLTWSEIEVGSWAELSRHLNEYDPGWHFRGHQSSKWHLETSIERCFRKFADQMAKSGFRVPPYAFEDQLLEMFQRRAHHYLGSAALPSDKTEWLALMQHYGAPTRLMDWTRSPYVAAYFAAEDANGEQPFAIWAINGNWLENEARERLGLDPVDNHPTQAGMYIKSWAGYHARKYLATVIDAEDTTPGVYLVEPFKMNERLTVQQGLFLAPARPFSFEENLGTYSRQDVLANVHKLVVPSVLRDEVLIELAKMNVNRATLFPGLEGFAVSLKYVSSTLPGTMWTANKYIKRLASVKGTEVADRTE